MEAGRRRSRSARDPLRACAAKRSLFEVCPRSPPAWPRAGRANPSWRRLARRRGRRRARRRRGSTRRRSPATAARRRQSWPLPSPTRTALASRGPGARKGRPLPAAAAASRSWSTWLAAKTAVRASAGSHRRGSRSSSRGRRPEGVRARQPSSRLPPRPGTRRSRSWTWAGASAKTDGAAAAPRRHSCPGAPGGHKVLHKGGGRMAGCAGASNLGEVEVCCIRWCRDGPPRDCAHSAGKIMRAIGGSTAETRNMVFCCTK
mmetsp:Transcript_104057/g.333583  ORF Transcript_104057/g.333583 Transcript_104057/m.333583 type:complete len:260 (+) Transcript_104057:213-992(+)